MNKLNEKDIVQLFVSRLVRKSARRGATDDIAVIPVKTGQSCINLILKCDMLVESTDVPSLMQPWQIARKSVIACVSDLAAKGVRPYACLISVGIPKKYSENNLQSLLLGFSKVSNEYKVDIVGGDTNESKELVIDCNMIGLTDIDSNYIPKRNGGKAGDLVVVSGKFGYTSSALKIIFFHPATSSKFKAKALSSILTPRPNFAFGISFAKFFSSSMDSSDGLSCSLYELAQQSNNDLLINRLPTSKDVCDFALRNSYNVEDLVFFGGEEYETVATIPKSNFKMMEAIATKQHIKMHVIGEVTNGTGKVYLSYDNNDNKKSSNNNKNNKPRLLKNQGFMHFSR
ncbi:MAG TPA: thiamine-phosphate kinase [Nitrososphaeraceae archaeon]|nr:thiamine-phosphate kinase [Nitrososphaeraceae archaeon]